VPYEDLHNAMRALSVAQRREAKILQAEARGYAWGWQDARAIRDDSVPEAFAEAYLSHCVNHFTTGRMRYSVWSAWESFSKLGVIG